MEERDLAIVRMLAKVFETGVKVAKNEFTEFQKESHAILSSRNGMSKYNQPVNLHTPRDDDNTKLPECPFSEAFRRITQSHGDDFCFLFSVKDFLDGRFGAFLSVKGLLKAILDESSANSFDRGCAAVQSLCDFCVGPSSLSFEQDVCSLHFLTGSLEFFHNILANLLFRIRQINNILLRTVGVQETDKLIPISDHQLQNCDTPQFRRTTPLVETLPDVEWKKVRWEMYEFSLRHVFAPDKLFELFDYLPRLFGIAVGCRDWSYANRIFNEAIQALKRIQDRFDVTLGDKLVSDRDKTKIWKKHFEHLREAFLKSLPNSCSINSQFKFKELYARIIDDRSGIGKLFEDDVILLSKKMFCRDLARRPYKSFLLRESPASFECESTTVPDDLVGELADRAQKITELLKESSCTRQEVMPILFPTRPLSAADISMLRPNSGADLRYLKQTLNTVRGTLYRIDSEDNLHDTEPIRAKRKPRKKKMSFESGMGGSQESHALL